VEVASLDKLEGHGLKENPTSTNGRKRPLQPLSPELVLIDPELASAARQALPEAGAWRPGTEIAPLTRRLDVAKERPPARPPTPQPTRTRLRRADPEQRRGDVPLVHESPVSGRTESETAASSGLRRLGSAAVGGGLFAAGFAVAVLILDGSQPSPVRDIDGPVPMSARAPGTVRPANPNTRDTVTAKRPKRAREAASSRRGGAARRTKRRSDYRRTLMLSQTDVMIGAFPVKGARPSAAVAVFGRPTRRTARRFYCHIAWQRVGMLLTFYDLNGRAPCRRGTFVRAVITGKGWRTAKGARIGGAVASLRRRHPEATSGSGGWWSLVRIQRRTFEPWRPDPGIAARVRNGRVVAFYIT
jgi:hypothetical protein